MNKYVQIEERLSEMVMLVFQKDFNINEDTHEEEADRILMEMNQGKNSIWHQFFKGMSEHLYIEILKYLHSFKSKQKKK